MNNTLNENQVYDGQVAYETRKQLREIRDQARNEYLKCRETWCRARKVLEEADDCVNASLRFWREAFSAVSDAEELEMQKNPYVKTDEDGNVFYYKDAAMTILHREDGPAIEYKCGDKLWYQNDKVHREDGPAIEYASGTKEWWLNDIFQRDPVGSAR